MKKRLQEILLRTRRQLLLWRRGQQPSPFAGEGLDFRELRPYTLDDDIRHLNWKSMARSRQPMVNLFNESRQIHVVAVYLNSGGLAVGSPRSKKDQAVELITALSFAAVEGENLMGALFFDEALRAWHPPKLRRIEVDRNFETATGLDPLGRQVDYKVLAETLQSRLKRQSLIFLIGDFMDRPELAALTARHELRCLVLRDPLDETLPVGEFRVADARSGQSEPWVIDRGTSRRYRELVRRHDAELAENFRRHRIAWEKIYTHDDAVKKLIDFTRREA